MNGIKGESQSYPFFKKTKLYLLLSNTGGEGRSGWGLWGEVIRNFTFQWVMKILAIALDIYNEIIKRVSVE